MMILQPNQQMTAQFTDSTALLAFGLLLVTAAAVFMLVTVWHLCSPARQGKI